MQVLTGTRLEGEHKSRLQVSDATRSALARLEGEHVDKSLVKILSYERVGFAPVLPCATANNSISPMALNFSRNGNEFLFT